MGPAIIVGLLVIVVALVGLLAVLLTRRQQATGTSLVQAEEQASRLVAEGESKHKELLVQAREETLALRTTLEDEVRERRAEAARVEQRLTQKEENLDKKIEGLERREQSLRDREAQIERLRTEAEAMRDRQQGELERVASLTAGEARDQLLGAIESEVRDEGSRRVREMEKDVEATAGPRARKMRVAAIADLSGFEDNQVHGIATG